MVRPRPVPVTPSFEIITAARLHLGLLDTCDPFGGVGVMIDRPPTRVRVHPSNQFAALGAAADRVQSVAERFATYWQMDELPRCTIEVLERPRPHSGLGSGTQLAMAVAEALCQFTGRPVDRRRMAVDIAGRGRRSAVGAHGYFDGGLIYEAAAREAEDFNGLPRRPGGIGFQPVKPLNEAEELNRVQRRIELPGMWRVLLVQTTPATPAVAGEAELEHFARLPPAGQLERERLTREVQDHLLPAAAAGDFQAWSRSVHRYNRESGQLFAAVQGGPYNGPEIAAWIDRLRGLGVEGVGQSSWGPTVFAFCESPEQASELQARLGTPAPITITPIANQGRTLKVA